MTYRQYDNRLSKLENIDAQIAELEKARADLIAAIKESMNDAETVKTSRYIVRYTRAVSNRFDSAAFKAAHAALYKAFSKPTETRRFSYSPIV